MADTALATAGASQDSRRNGGEQEELALVETSLLELPAKMRWLNSTFRATVNGQVTDTCRGIAEKYLATAAQRGGGSARRAL